MKTFWIIFMVASMAGFTACQDAANDEEPEIELPEEIEEPEVNLPPFVPRKDILLTEAEQQVACQTNVFAFEWLRHVYKNEKAEKNIFISPLSASFALQMLDNGAAGDTHREIQTALGFGGFSREEQNTYAQKMIEAMQGADTRSAFEIANSIWIRQNFPALESFRDVNKQYFEAEVRNEDFGDPATPKLINGWVSEKTHGRIPEILKEVSPLSVMYIINTLYFNGLWQSPFIMESTGDEVFHNMNGTTPSLPTMKKTVSSLNYAEEEQFGVVELPFGNGTFGMVVVLPDRDVSLASVIEQMDEELWKQCLADLTGYSNEIVYLRLPRFKVEYERSLNEDLKALGMPSIFDGGKADFSLINPDAELCVSEVRQKTFAEVAENGMEAAAATIIEMELGNLLPPANPPRVDFYVNRPFLFFVKEQSTGTIFFAGAIKNL